MTGGSKPFSRQACSILGRMTAFAMCVQFQVSRYSIPLTAATATCSASISAFGGKEPSFSIALAKALASSEILSSGIPSSALRRREAASALPREASATTISEMKRSNSDRRLSHQSAVMFWQAAARTSLLGLAVR